MIVSILWVDDESDIAEAKSGRAKEEIADLLRRCSPRHYPKKVIAFAAVLIEAIDPPARAARGDGQIEAITDPMEARRGAVRTRSSSAQD